MDKEKEKEEDKEKEKKEVEIEQREGKDREINENEKEKKISAEMDKVIGSRRGEVMMAISFYNVPALMYTGI